MSHASDWVVRLLRAAVLGALALVGALMCLPLDVPLAAPAGTTDVLAIPGRANAHVSLASSGTFVAAVWAAALPDGTTDVFAAASRDEGATFAPPVRVNVRPGEARVNGEQPPRVALVAGTAATPRIVVLWTAKAAAGTTLLTSHSDDGGKTFGASTLVPATDAPGNRGWQAIAADSTGRIHAVWLDHRRMVPTGTKAAPGTHRHGEGARTATHDGVAMAQQSDLYFDTLSDAAAPRAVTPGVCYCCKTAIAFGKANQIFLAWRHVYPGNLRDMAFAASSDGGRSFSRPVRVSEDNWMLDGCPDDGPSMRTDATGRIHLVWPAVVDERGSPVKALFHAESGDGRAFTPRVRLPTHGQANHPQLAVAGDGTLLVTWDESGRGSRQIVWARSAPGNGARVPFVRQPIDGAAGVYPSVIPTRRGALIAWTSGAPDRSEIRLTRVE